METGSAIGDAFNFVQIDDRLATCGQPTEEQFRNAQKSGYEVVINLAPDGLESSLPGEAELLASLGIDYYQIPVPWTDPRLEHLEQFEKLMAKTSGKKALIHCQANYRVTVFFTCYAMARLGWSAEQADALLERVWHTPKIESEETWQAFVASARQRR